MFASRNDQKLWHVCWVSEENPHTSMSLSDQRLPGSGALCDEHPTSHPPSPHAPTGLALLGGASASDLTLLGEGSSINFLGDKATAARLSVSCSTDGAALKWISPTEVMAFSENDGKGESSKGAERRRMVWEGTEKETEKAEAAKEGQMTATTTKYTTASMAMTKEQQQMAAAKEAMEKAEAAKEGQMTTTTTMATMATTTTSKDDTKTMNTTAMKTTSSSTPKGVVRARVSGIPANCEGAPIQSLCYSEDPDFPALVWCTWVGSSANETNGPYSLQVKKFNTSGTQFFVDCKVPSIEKVAKMTTGSKLDLFLGHGLKDAIRPVPYTGYKGGNAVTVSKAPGGPPAPSAPPSPST